MVFINFAPQITRKTRLLFLPLFHFLSPFYCSFPPVTRLFIHCNSMWFIARFITVYIILYYLHILLHYLFSYILGKQSHKIWKLLLFLSQSNLLWNHVLELVISEKTSYICLIPLHISYQYPEIAVCLCHQATFWLNFQEMQSLSKLFRRLKSEDI